MILLILGGLGIALSIVGLLLNVLGMGAGAMQGGEQAAPAMISGGFGIVSSIVGAIGSAFVVYGALQMKNLQSHGMAVAASVVAMLPFISPCCIVGLPVGIWSMVLLMKPEVKSAFGG
ncbi:MAG: hypothetical protein R3E01_30135 [Pirellulaceae bacterium]|nr:hypothetical protein [Planctomycetales bacterium]